MIAHAEPGRMITHAEPDDELCHTWCCNPDLAICGTDISGLEDCYASEEECGKLCPLCQLAAQAPCPRCGDA